MRCPFCDRGTIAGSTCDRCGVAVPAGSVEPMRAPRRADYHDHPLDDGHVGGFTDYARTKADK